MPTPESSVIDDGLPSAGSTPSSSSQSGSSFSPTEASHSDGLEATFSGSPVTPAFVGGVGALKYVLAGSQTMALRPLGVPFSPPAIGGRTLYRFRVLSSDLTKGLSIGLMKGSPTTALVADGVFAWWNGTALKLAFASGAASTANYTTAGSSVIPPGLCDLVLDVQAGLSGHNVILYCNGVFVGSLWNLTLPSGLFPCVCAIGAADVSVSLVSSQVVG